MRDIRFRAWDKNAKKMLRSCYDFDDVNYFLSPFTGQTQIFKRPSKDDSDYSGRTGVIANVDWLYPGPMNIDLHWMQYTGLKDKNGKEIWESDIVTDGGHQNNHCLSGTHAVEFSCGGFSPFAISGWEGTFLVDEDGIADCEVIGNIFEHPELLEKK